MIEKLRREEAVADQLLPGLTDAFGDHESTLPERRSLGASAERGAPHP